MTGNTGRQAEKITPPPSIRKFRDKRPRFTKQPAAFTAASLAAGLQGVVDEYDSDDEAADIDPLMRYREKQRGTT